MPATCRRSSKMPPWELTSLTRQVGYTFVDHNTKTNDLAAPPKSTGDLAKRLDNGTP